MCLPHQRAFCLWGKPEVASDWLSLNSDLYPDELQAVYCVQTLIFCEQIVARNSGNRVQDSKLLRFRQNEKIFVSGIRIFSKPRSYIASVMDFDIFVRCRRKFSFFFQFEDY